jgi:hypothetical protein
MSAALLYGGHVFANGIRQHYLRYGGKGQPIILIPGITSPAITWGFVAERLAERHDVYVPTSGDEVYPRPAPASIMASMPWLPM